MESERFFVGDGDGNIKRRTNFAVVKFLLITNRPQAVRENATLLQVQVQETNVHWQCG